MPEMVAQFGSCFTLLKPTQGADWGPSVNGLLLVRSSFHGRPTMPLIDF